jgi:GH15 family glucan-1,4-alpha-glucosidase
MPLPLEDYALIGDCHTSALIGRDGSMDWLCLPRFDSGACFAALLGGPEHGRWLIAPAGEVTRSKRAYRDGTMVLETELETAEGAVRMIEFMPLSDERWDVVRIVEGIRGTVPMRMQLVIRFDYGSVVPWVRKVDGALNATAGPHTLELRTGVKPRGENKTTVADFTVRKGERVEFALNYHPSYEPSPGPLDPRKALRQTEKAWSKWSGQCKYKGRWDAQVLRSLITLKALTYGPTGGIVAAPTTSLPERLQGARNWDYRYCWLRDATFTLNALLLAGFHDEAVAWRAWLLRAAAGSPQDLQTLYSVTGERRLDEYELPWLPGYENAPPVRVGNAASTQFQLDVYGEIADTLHLARAAKLPFEPAAWNIQRVLLEFLDTHWQLPDDGIWEIRGPARHFTHSKVMAWVAFDRAVKDAETFGLEGPVDRWRATRDAIHAQVCERAYDAQRNTFVQAYDTPHLDASLLLIPQVGFLPPQDPRVTGTVSAIERGLVVDGLVHRYNTAQAHLDPLPAGEGTFLPCSFWLANALALTGRREEAAALFERLLALANDVGLLAEEYDVRSKRQMGNFPQALTHMALINTAHLLSTPEEHARSASDQGERPAAVARTQRGKRVSNPRGTHESRPGAP